MKGRMKKIPLSGASLKNIAYLSMFVDHFFAVVFVEVMERHSPAGYGDDLLDAVYSAGRAAGRPAFILFCFLAVESFMHTHSRRNYLLRLGGFALVSEIPFDLAFSGQIIDRSSQNVFFTLFLGVSVLTVWAWAGGNIRMLRKARGGWDSARHICVAVFSAIRYGVVLLGCGAAYCLRTDYKYMGVLLIFTFYLLYGKGIVLKTAAAGCVMFFGTWSMNCLRYLDVYSAEYLLRHSLRELYGLAAFVPIFLYDRSRGRQMPKAFCYGFYPVHLLVLYGVAGIIAGV